MRTTPTTTIFIVLSWLLLAAGGLSACDEERELVCEDEIHSPGDSWDAGDGCNTCSCDADGLVSCTLAECVETCEDGHEPGDTWDADDGCNTCTCTDDLEIACTLMACIDTCEDGHLPGDTWDADDGCNTCTCTQDLQIACTEIACPPDCDQLAQDYAASVQAASTCTADDECRWVYGHCGVGIGGCYEIVNQTPVEEDLATIAQAFTESGCTSGVCDCAPPPETIFCEDGVCQAEYAF